MRVSRGLSTAEGLVGPTGDGADLSNGGARWERGDDETSYVLVSEENMTEKTAVEKDGEIG